MSNQLINKLVDMVASIREQAKIIDQKNKTNKAFTYRKDSNLFSESLFRCKSEYIVPYVNETNTLINELESLLNQNKSVYFNQRLELVEQQISALINSINANDSLNKVSKQRSIHQNNKYKKAAQSLFQPVQALHQKLAETYEFERRLMAMLEAKQVQFSQATAAKKQQFSDELLILHQRLGRCRQAISKLERQIELREKR